DHDLQLEYYLPAVLESADSRVAWRILHVTRGKRARAAPVAQLYEQPGCTTSARRVRSRRWRNR
ncbi:hypothetical protein RKE29_06750, partial [Streptomyces sp. B1866]|uniref:hypothetical protein n=1 Tax=Streptomyces sp. B1866 TaxID=3075431 RepID=UPI00288D4354